LSFETVTIGDARLILGDCMDILPTLGKVDAVITDPPYGETSLEWDVRVDGWPELLKSDVLWCFGSLRYFMAQRFDGWTHGQEIVWEKHNGSMFHADRFKRVHELAVQFYRGKWADIHKQPVYTYEATARTVRRKNRPAHSGNIDAGAYVSEDGGPKLQRSVIYARSCHGFAQHPTQKPTEIIDPLISYSIPMGGIALDPFMGSGTTGVAAIQLGRKFIGIEREPKYFDIACKRIEQAYAQGKLFEPEAIKQEQAALL
jgi:site-specific DNA-methyltransferase (adenine-specific)